MRPAEQSPLALDACGALNLAAVMPLRSAADQVGRPLVMVRQAAAEVLYLEDRDEEGEPSRTLVTVEGLLVVDLTQAELAAYVELAVELDDGEAATLAVAQARAWPVMTDDRKALRIARSLVPPVAVLTTASILRGWAARQRMDDTAVGEVLRRVEARATFSPSQRDPDRDWWHRCIAAAG